MRNSQWNHAGNDGAIDGVTMYDATPRLQNAFDGSSPFVGETATLTLTVQNTTENGAKPGWSFTESLPDGLVLAAEPDARTTCAQGDVSASGGGSTVAVSGGLAAGSASCTVTVDVTSDAPGTYSVGPSTVTAHVGVDLPDVASITFRPEQNALVVDDQPVLSESDDAFADLGEGIAFAQVVTNAGALTVTDVRVDGSNGAVRCAASVLAPGASTSCTTTSRAVVQADVDRGHIDDDVTATARSPRGALVRATATAVQPTALAAPSITTALSAHLGTDDVPVPGAPVELSLTVGNSGNVTLHDVTAAVPDHGGIAVDCPAGDLAPRATVECTVEDHLLTQDDIDRGSVAFTDRAVGTAPDGRVVDADDQATVAVRQAPEIRTEITAHLAPSEHEVPSAGDVVEAAIVVTNAGNTTLTDVASAVRDRPELPVGCADVMLAPGASTPCSVPDVVLTQDDIETGSVELSETATGTAPDGSSVSADDAVSVGLDARSALFLQGAWTPSGSDRVRPGDTIASSYQVTNTSNLVVRALALESTRAGAISCRVEELAPGEQTECRGRRASEVTEGDAAVGRIVFEAVARGRVAREDGALGRVGPVDVRSNVVRAAFAVEPTPSALAFTGADLTGTVLVAGGLVATGAGVLSGVWLRRRRSRS